SIQLAVGIAVVFQELPRVLAALPDALALVAEPRSRLLHQVLVHRQVQQVALAGDPLSIKDVEFGLANRSRHRHLLWRQCAGCPPAPTNKTSMRARQSWSPGSRTSRQSSRGSG